MFRKLCLAFLCTFVILNLASCKKEEALETGEEFAAETGTEIKPGEMVLIPEGEFILGANEKDSTAFPQQKVRLPAYWIDKYEVTNAEFLDFCIQDGYSSEGNYRLFFTSEKGQYPVVNVTWNDAAAYCKWAGKRLPTEEEWEKAARGPEGNRYPWGEKWEATQTNTYEERMGGPVAIAQYNDISPYGVHDMMGNAQEWTGSWYKAYRGNSKSDPNFGERMRVLRGARWDTYGSKSQVWARSAALPKALYGYGFRCAKDATPEEAAQAGQGK